MFNIASLVSVGIIAEEKGRPLLARNIYFNQGIYPPWQQEMGFEFSIEETGFEKAYSQRHALSIDKMERTGATCTVWLTGMDRLEST
jgi:hypothetical protein